MGSGLRHYSSKDTHRFWYPKGPRGGYVQQRFVDRVREDHGDAWEDPEDLEPAPEGEKPPPAGGDEDEAPPDEPTPAACFPPPPPPVHPAKATSCSGPPAKANQRDPNRNKGYGRKKSRP